MLLIIVNFGLFVRETNLPLLAMWKKIFFNKKKSNKRLFEINCFSNTTWNVPYFYPCESDGYCLPCTVHISGSWNPSHDWLSVFWAITDWIAVYTVYIHCFLAIFIYIQLLLVIRYRKSKVQTCGPFFARFRLFHMTNFQIWFRGCTSTVII